MGRKLWVVGDAQKAQAHQVIESHIDSEFSRIGRKALAAKAWGAAAASAAPVGAIAAIFGAGLPIAAAGVAVSVVCARRLYANLSGKEAMLDLMGSTMDSSDDISASGEDPVMIELLDRKLARRLEGLGLRREPWRSREAGAEPGRPVEASADPLAPLDLPPLKAPSQNEMDVGSDASREAARSRPAGARSGR